MRLRRLDLTRYGKFTDRSIDFGERVAGQPDLHVVYGPNEAGKSTAFSAFLDLLFGIGTQSAYGFLHPYPTMRIGGTLEFGTERHGFARIKRPQNSLLDSEDRPIPESAIRGELGGIERDGYRTMFSLDDETLEKGGESILASKGDLGQLLFSASAGLAHLSHKLADLRGEADGFYKYRARSGGLADLKTRLAELKAERERLDTLASDHARLIETRDRTTSHYDEAVVERTRIQARLDEIQRHLVALPRLVKLRDIRHHLAPLLDLPEAPPGWADELPGMQKQEIALVVQTRAAADDIRRLEDELATIVVDETALQLAGGVERLTELRARYVTAEKDLPERRLQLRQLDLAIAGILQRIEQDGEVEPGRLVLTAMTVGRLRELIEVRSGLDAATRNASKELAEARRRLSETAASLPEAGIDLQAAQERERAMAELAIIVEALRSADHQVWHRLAERARSEALDGLAEHLTLLRPWHGTAEDLAGLRCPGPEMLQRWKAARTEAKTVLTRHQAECERLTTQIRHLEAERTSFSATMGIVTDQEAAELRTQREQAWAAHRRVLDAASADAFEAVLRHDDLVGAGRLSHMSELARLHHSSQALTVAQADLERAVELRESAAAALGALDAEVTGAARAIASGSALGSSLPELEDWLGRRDETLAAREVVRRAERDLRAAQSDAAAATDRLRSALGCVGLAQDHNMGFDGLLADAQATLDREAALRRRRSELAERQRDVVARESEAEQAAADEQIWAKAWSTACRSCWLGDRSEMPAIADVREILVAVADLAPTIEKRAGLVDRVEKMEKDQAAFRDEVMRLADALRIPASSIAVLDLAQRIGESMRTAGTERDHRVKLREQLEAAAERQRELAATVALHDEQKQRMAAFFGVATLEEVAKSLSDIAMREVLRGQAEEVERDILDAVRASDVPAAEAALDTADRSALEVEHIELKARSDDQDRRCHELFAARSAAIDQVEVIGGDARVAAIEERRRTTLLEIEDGAMRYLQLRAGIAAAEQALTSYRERHRSSMMARASAAFRTISRGVYSGLAAQPGKEGETLIALSAAGGSKAAHELSKGTRFQLYLALRVAGYHEFVRARSAVPFVADDIMETFDDFRAEEAFRLFAEMAQAGQVIYLTHHQHLCEIVRRVCPTAGVHQLGDIIQRQNA